MRKILALLACLLSTGALAQTGSNKTPTVINAEINSLFPDNTTGAITPNGLRQVTLDVVASSLQAIWPGVSTNVAGIGAPGLQLNGCTTIATCGLFLFNGNPTVASLAFPLLRVQRNSTNNFGAGGAIPNVVEVLEDTSANQTAASFTFLAQTNNHTDGSTGAANVALTAQIFKSNTAPDTNEIGTSWGAVLNCQSFQVKVNPVYGCTGAEISVALAPGSGTDSNKQRIGLLIPFQTTDGSADAGIHIGYGLIMTANNSVVLDTAIDVRTGAGDVFVVTGAGAVTAAGTVNAPSFGATTVGASGGYTQADGTGKFAHIRAASADVWQLRVTDFTALFSTVLQWNELQFTVNQHANYTQSTALPTLTAGCNGAGSSVVAGSTDVAGNVVGQTNPATSCTLQFATAYTSAPICVAIGNGGTLALTPTTANIQVGLPTTTGNTSFRWSYHCYGL